ncbi:hypothetical protein MC885_020284 [Smutsia gigantea]|nr:hypothetical protein MC885_020284 [Smutsia gigantea]
MSLPSAPHRCHGVVEDSEESCTLSSHPGNVGSKSGGDKIFSLKKWNVMAMWSWDVDCKQSLPPLPAGLGGPRNRQMRVVEGFLHAVVQSPAGSCYQVPCKG